MSAHDVQWYRVQFHTAVAIVRCAPISNANAIFSYAGTAILCARRSVGGNTSSVFASADVQFRLRRFSFVRAFVGRGADGGGGGGGNGGYGARADGGRGWTRRTFLVRTMGTRTAMRGERRGWPSSQSYSAFLSTASGTLVPTVSSIAGF